MVCVVWFSLLFIVAISGQQVVYVCESTGSDANTCESENLPCGSLERAFEVASSASSIIVNICPGTYTGTSNIQLQIPAVPITIQKSGTDANEVIFDGQDSCEIVFNVTNAALTLKDITITSCSRGIMFEPSQAQQSLDLTSVNILSCSLGIFVKTVGGTFSATGTWNVSDTGVGIFLEEASNITLYNGVFTGARFYSLQLQPDSEPTFSIRDLIFQDTTGIYFVGGAGSTGILENCMFSNIQVENVIDINGGDWSIQNCQISESLCEKAVVYRGVEMANALTLVANDFSTCSAGVYFNAEGRLTILGGTIAVNETCIQVDRATGVRVEDNVQLTDCYIASINVNYTSDVISELVISDVHFSNCVTMFATVASETEGEITRCSFTDVIIQALVITGGTWNINNIDIVSIAPNFFSNGGIVSLLSSSFGSANFTITDSHFTNGYTSEKGGAIYGYDIDLYIARTVFTNNHAQAGGAIYLSQFDHFYVDNCTFTDNDADEFGGAIALASATGVTTYAAFMSTTFVENSAATGAAIACCGDTAETGCDVTVVYQDSNIQFESNENTAEDGKDVTCNIITQGTNQDKGDTEIDSWVYWVILGSMATLIIIGILISLLVFYIVKKRATYVTLE